VVVLFGNHQPAIHFRVRKITIIVVVVTVAIIVVVVSSSSSSSSFSPSPSYLPYPRSSFQTLYGGEIAVVVPVKTGAGDSTVEVVLESGKLECI
jgi:hypothetical protein